jgi:hypothetical protein
VANKHKGEATIVVGTAPDERTYTLLLSFDALVNIEEATGQDIGAVFESLKDRPRLKTIRHVFFAALRENHPELTERLAGELLLQTSMQDVVLAIQRAGEAAFPQAADDAGGDGGAHPPKAAAGTGPSSPPEQSKPV